MTNGTTIHGQLILQLQSDRWSTKIREQAWPYKLNWVVDEEGVMEAATKWPGSVALVEFQTIAQIRECKRFAKRINSPYDLRWIAVGDRSILGWETLLTAVGFTATFWSTTQVERIGQLANQHFSRSQLRTSLALEDRIQLELPWKPNQYS